MGAMRRWFGRKDTIEDRLQAERPQPPEPLVRSILADIRADRERPTMRSRTRVAALSTAVLVALLAVGGLGYAATFATQIVAKITHPKIVVTHRTVLRPSIVNAAEDQYGTTTATTATTATTTGGEETVAAQLGQGASVSTSAPGSSTQVTVAWDPATFTTAADVTVDPTPSLTSTATLLGAGNSLVSIVATDPATGQPIHTLSTPMDIVFANVPAGYVPTVSTDGVTFRALSLLAGTTLPADQQDGYYIAGGVIHVLTRHLTLFGVVYKGNISVSETGRKLAAPNSGKWGDPLRIHTGPPALRIVTTPTANATRIPFTFFVDEQAALYVHVLSGTQQIVLGGGSKIAGMKIGGGLTKTQHLAILRPGTITASLEVPKVRMHPGKLSLVVTVVDFDGNKVTRTIAVKR